MEGRGREAGGGAGPGGGGVREEGLLRYLWVVKLVGRIVLRHNHLGGSEAGVGETKAPHGSPKDVAALGGWVSRRPAMTHA